MRNLIVKSSMLVLLLLSVGIFDAKASDSDIEQVGKFLATGNSTDLAAHFNESLSVAILNEEANYQKAQAQVVVQEFFADYSPQSFTLIHSGESSEGSKFGTGTLSTLNGSFRVYYLIRSSDSGFLIHDLRFEED